MIIEIERGLEALKNELESRGYETFYSGENKVADAVLYSGETFPRDAYGSSYVKMFAATNTKGFRGALLINVDDKCIDEIISILNNRSYGPLF